MSDDYSDYEYVINETDKTTMQNLTKMGEHLKALKLKMIEAEAVFKQAEKEYNYYASTVLPMEMLSAGMREVVLMSGGKMTYDSKFYCQPNKNVADRQLMAEWLRKNGGEHLVKVKAEVPGAAIDVLKVNSIPFVEIDDINTNSLKAFLKDKIGINGGMAQIQVSDIPDCMHFQEVATVNIEV